jgi:large subunit ribosomal protein L9
MRIVLLDDLAGVGNAGDTVEVKNGYARNWLLPQGLAERATKDAINRVTLIRKAGEAKRAARMTEASGKFALLGEKTLVIRLKTGAGNRVFGAVTPSLLVDEAKAQFGMALERRHVMLEEPIKQLGDFTIPLRASAEVTGELKVTVLPMLKKGQTAEQQLRQLAAQRAAAGGESPAEETVDESSTEAAAEAAAAEASEVVAEQLAETVEA